VAKEKHHNRDSELAEVQRREAAAEAEMERETQKEVMRRMGILAAQHGARGDDAFIESLRPEVERTVRWQMKLLKRFVHSCVPLVDKDVAAGVGTRKEVEKLYLGLVQSAYQHALTLHGKKMEFVTDEWCEDWVYKLAAPEREELRRRNRRR
jgi:hypothetical protein